MSDEPELTFRTSLLGRERYVLTENRMQITRKGLGWSTESAIPLGDIDPDPIHYKKRPTHYLGIALVAGIVAAAIFCLISLDDLADPEAAVDFGIFAGFLSFAAIAFVIGFFLKKEEYLLFLNSAESVALAIPRSRPDPATFEEFVQELTSRIQHCRHRRRQATNAPEIEELAELLADGRISAQQLRRVKDELLEDESDQ